MRCITSDIVQTLMNENTAMPRGDESILLTGATGLVGGAVLSRLVSRHQQTVYCLVRPRPGRSLAGRIAERLGGQAPTAGSSRIVPIDGDVTLADLGLEPEVGLTLQSKVE